MYIALYIAIIVQCHPQRDATDDLSSDYHVLSYYVADDLRPLAEQERATANVALDVTIDLNLAFCADISGNREILANDGRNRFAGG